MFRQKILFAIAVVSMLGACTNRPANTPGFRANVSETLNVQLAPALVPQTIRALQGSAALDDTKVGLQIQPTYNTRRRSTVATEAYTAALDDAAAKAQAIAAHERLALGRVQSVTEMTPQAAGESGYIGARQPEPVRSRGATIVAPANGVVTLAVTFDAGNVPISVFGTHAGPLTEYSLRDATGLSVTIRARDENLGAAQRRLGSVEDSVRGIVARFGARPQDIVVTSADANTF